MLAKTLSADVLPAFALAGRLGPRVADAGRATRLRPELRVQADARIAVVRSRVGERPVGGVGRRPSSSWHSPPRLVSPERRWLKATPPPVCVLFWPNWKRRRKHVPGPGDGFALDVEERERRANCARRSGRATPFADSCSVRLARIEVHRARQRRRQSRSAPGTARRPAHARRDPECAS